MSIKRFIKQQKIKYKNNLIVKLAKAKKENSILRKKVAELVIENRLTIDEITKKNETIRELSLKAKNGL